MTTKKLSNYKNLLNREIGISNVIYKELLAFAEEKELKDGEFLKQIAEIRENLERKLNDLIIPTIEKPLSKDTIAEIQEMHEKMDKMNEKFDTKLGILEQNFDEMIVILKKIQDAVELSAPNNI